MLRPRKGHHLSHAVLPQGYCGRPANDSMDYLAAAAVLVPAAGASASPSFLKRWYSVAASGPEMLCHTLKMALGTAAKGEKCAAARAAPKPEFCMPTSIDMVLRCDTGMPMSLAIQ